MSKTIKLRALLFLIAVMFSACNTSDTETVPEYSAAVDQNDLDLLGYEYIIAATAHGTGTISYAMNPEPGVDLRGDRLLQRYRDAEEKYNITITRINNDSTF